MTKYTIPISTHVRLYKDRRFETLPESMFSQRELVYTDDNRDDPDYWVEDVFAFKLPKNDREIKYLVVDKVNVKVSKNNDG